MSLSILKASCFPTKDILLGRNIQQKLGFIKITYFSMDPLDVVVAILLRLAIMTKIMKSHGQYAFNGISFTNN
jgi:hypothetical protein